jgi:two-component system, response regulator YesN
MVNLKKISLNKNRIFFCWMKSYILILVIPVFIAVITYYMSIRIIKEEVDKAHYASLNQLKTIIEGKFDEIERIANQIAMDKNLAQILYSHNSDENHNDEVLNIIRFQRDLAKFKSTNYFIEDTYVYINDKDYILSSTNHFRAEYFPFISKGFFLLSPEELSDLVNNNKAKYYRIIRNTEANGTTKRKVVFVHSVYLTDFSKAKATIIIVVDERNLNKLLQNVEWIPQTKVLVVDESNEFIGNYSKGTLPEFLTFENLENKKTTFYTKYMKEDMAVIHMNSSKVQWKYISLIPSKVFLQKIEYIKKMVYLYICICMISGLLAAYYFSKKNYSPLKNMIFMYVNRLGKKLSDEQNEMKFLENSFIKLLDENESYTNRLRQQNEAMRNNIFSRIMKGRVNNISSIKASLEAYGIQFKSENFVVMIFSIENINCKTFEESAISSDETMNLIYFVIKNVVEEFAGEKNLGYMTEVDGNIASVVNILQNEHGSDLEHVKKEMINIVKKSTVFIENKFGIILSAAISDIHPFVLGITRGYAEALEIVEYKKLMEDKNKIIHYSDVYNISDNSNNESFNLEKERQFINCIRGGDYKSAGSILDDIIANNFLKNVNSLQVAKCRMFGLVNSMLNAISEIKTGLDVEFFKELDPTNRLLNSKSIFELKKQVNFIFEKITEYHESRAKEEVPSWLEDVKNFVGNNYSDPGLSIMFISEQLNISNSHLSRTFKKHMGYGLLDYIHKVRLQKAKMLMNSDLNIKAIAEKVGYIESNTMIRAFKRYEGVTPGKFREIE